MSRHPNSLPETKEEYLRALLIGRLAGDLRMVDYALFLYHGECPLADAKNIMDIATRKIGV